MPDCVIVDFSWVYHRSFHAFKNIQFINEGKFIATGALYGSIRDLISLHKKHPNHFYIATEPESNSERCALQDNYKHGRTRVKGVYDLYDDTEELAANLPFADVVTSDNPGEADDVIFTLVKQMASTMDRIYLHAIDNDLIQAAAIPGVGKRLFFFEKRYKPILVWDYCVNKYGATPEQILIYRSIVGDPSDNMRPVIDRFPRRIATHIANQIKGPDEYKVEMAGHEVYGPKLMECMPSWILNYRMMRAREMNLIVKPKNPQFNIEPYIRKYGVASFRPIFQGYNDQNRANGLPETCG